ncbi:MAG: gamma-glutamyltransferase, partial [Gammaproteobacteria bacterium]
KYLGDPDYIKAPIDRLISTKNATKLRDHISRGEATTSETLGEGPVNDNGKSNTTHFSIIDKEGNRVAATLSLNIIFGSGFLAQGTGVLLNDEMDDFAIKPGTPNVYGIVGSEKNIIEPGKRPLSNMTPTFLVSEDRVGILGTPGGVRIPTMVLLGILDFAAGNPADSWVSLARYHHQFLPDIVQFEPEAFTADEQRKLQEMHHDLNPLERRYGNMQAILWDKKANQVTAASQPGKLGQSAVD